MTDEPDTPLARGIETIRAFAATLPETPGVYRMLGEKSDVLYVGKARALKRRVTSYTQRERLSGRLQRMVSQTRRMEVIHTATEIEALLLEQNLIKQMKPRYNILLRDDKSFPYLLITGDHDFPRLMKHRGAQNKVGDYYGPIAFAGSVTKTIESLMRAFQLRDCSDAVFLSRTRPCLQYHIKRCSAPCVGFVTQAQYAAQVAEAKAFLEGRSDAIKQDISAAMHAASDAMDFETAAKLRDRLKALAGIGMQQTINVAGLGDADLIACVQDADKNVSCVQVFFFRHSQNFGNRAFYPKHDEGQSAAEVLEAFLGQFYTHLSPPPLILTNIAFEESDLLCEALQSRHDLKKRPEITTPQRGERVKLIDFATDNARQALTRHITSRAQDRETLAAVAQVLGLSEMPNRIEIYDNSHSGGTLMVAGMVVAGPEGFRRAAYRKFNIKHAAASDDFGMMREVMERRFAHLQDAAEEDAEGLSTLPDLLLIDGGLGQLNAVYAVLDALNLSDKIAVVGISKGPDRNAGREWLHRRGHESFQLPVDDARLHYLQRLRDESHRFVIGAMRTRRQKTMVGSRLDDIPGIGPKRKKALLSHFGSAKMVERAGLDDLRAVDGISDAFAKVIYDFFQGA